MTKPVSGLWKAAVLAAFSLSCGSASAAPPPSGAKYVALGSSYAAGTGLSHVAANSPGQCSQGTDNYPRQVAQAFKLQLVDRSCGGATTQHLLEGGQFGLPAQLDAVDAETRLVTITIGGNDVRFVADLGRFSCGHQTPDANRPCAAAPEFKEEEAFAQLNLSLRQIVQKVRERAPQARILFVDYMTVVPAAGTCAGLALSKEEASIMRTRAKRLSALTAKVAADTGADIVAASKLSANHDACSRQPWTWGFVSRDDPAQANAVPLHPRLIGTTAIAKAIIERLKR